MNKLKLLDLPNLPLTETYSDKYLGIDNLSYDAELYIDTFSNLVKLKNDLDNFSYSAENYSYRTATSFSSKISDDLRRFIDFKDHIEKKFNFNYKTCIEIGGNDLTLAKILHPKYHKITVIDPLAPQNFNNKNYPNIVPISKCDHEIDLSKFKEESTIVISRHTIEHIKDIDAHFKNLSKNLNPETLYIYEFPDFRQLINSLRFDAIFHQHLSYFDIYSFWQIIEKHGFKLIDFRLNTKGSCGGSTQVAFSKSYKKETFTKSQLNRIAYPYLNNNDLVEFFKDNFSLYKKICSNTSMQLLNSPFPIYGFGAGLMLPTFFYYSNIDPSLLEAIIDDDINKNGLTYSNLPLKIIFPNKNNLLDNWSCLITSLESFRAIYNAANKHSPKKIFSISLST